MRYSVPSEVHPVKDNSYRCAGMAESGQYDESYLREVTARDSLFPDMDYRIFQNRPYI